MKNAKWWVATAVATVAVVATAVTGVIVTDKNRLYYDPAPQLVDAKPVAFPLKKPDGEPNLANLAPMLDDARLGKASIQFRDVATGNVVLAIMTDGGSWNNIAELTKRIEQFRSQP